MKTIDELRRKMETLGGSLEDTGYAIHLDAPSGYEWAANSLPSLTIAYATNSQSWLVKAVQGEMASLRMGLRKVTEPERLAEHRHSLDDDNWGASDDAPSKKEWPK